MKINWFSPVPPARTAIADVAERIMPSIAKRMEVTVWTDSDEFDENRFPGVEVRSCRNTARIWPDINFADVSLYNIGNDARFHGHYAAILEQHPGIVVLHDFNLHEMHRERHRCLPGGISAFNRYVLRLAGAEALNTVLAYQREELDFETMVEQVPLIQSVTRFATGIISFNRAMQKPLEKETKAPLLLCPLPLDSVGRIPPPVNRPFDPARETLELVMFGFLNSPNRRLNEVLQAIAGFERGQVRLTLFGHIEDRPGLEEQIRRLGISGIVRYLGYLNEDEMEETLKQSHLAINLRNPSRGESSDALLKAWKFTLPVLVTRTGYYETLPSNTVCFVDPGNEVGGIRDHVSACMRDPRPYQQTGLKAHRYLMENHTTEIFAENLEAFLIKAETYRKKSFVLNFARRLSRLLEADFSQTGSAGILRPRLAAELADWIRDGDIPDIKTGSA